MSSPEPYICSAEDAEKLAGWLKERGGLAIWYSRNLSNPGASVTTPALTPEGKPYARPGWQYGDQPDRNITDAAEVQVAEDREVRRFRVGIRRGDGLCLKVTDGGSRRIRVAVAKAGKGAYYVFDYSTQEAVILAPKRILPLVDWLKEKSGQGKVSVGTAKGESES
jgi:hypothetical protein